MAFSYTNLSRRLNWAVQAYSQSQFFYGQASGVLYDPLYSPYIDRDAAEATSTTRGGSAFAIWPINRYRRMELFGSVVNYKQEYNDPLLEELSQDYQQDQFGQSVLQNGWFYPIGAAFVQETTIFREFGPVSGNTMRLSYEVAPQDRQFTEPSDRGPGPPEIHPARLVRPAGAARTRIQQLGRRARLHLLRRQL